jgi:hypothetical protein
MERRLTIYVRTYKTLLRTPNRDLAAERKVRRPKRLKMLWWESQIEVRSGVLESASIQFCQWNIPVEQEISTWLNELINTHTGADNKSLPTRLLLLKNSHVRLCQITDIDPVIRLANGGRLAYDDVFVPGCDWGIERSRRGYFVNERLGWTS